jgi:hypothetical protein|tara:strand:- start:1679 stop:1855 length:177 start_codon:yes stop_codon:yes gene_type:complete
LDHQINRELPDVAVPDRGYDQGFAAKISKRTARVGREILHRAIGLAGASKGTEETTTI